MASIKPLVLATAVCAAVGSGVAFFEYLSVSAARDARDQMIENSADRAAAIILERSELVGRSLRDVGVTLMEAERVGTSLTRAFHRYIEGSEMFKEHPEMSGVAFIRYLSAQDVAAEAARLDDDDFRRARGYPPFRVFPEAQGDIRAVYSLMAPLSLVQAQAGLDGLTTPRRSAIIEAIRTGELSMTDSIRLFSGETGVVLFHPVYETTQLVLAGGETLAPYGVVATAFGGDRFLADIAPVIEPLGLHVEIHDVVTYEGLPIDPGEDTLVASSRDASAPRLFNRPDVLIRDISIAGQTWRLFFKPRQALGEPSVTALHVVMGTLIALLSGLLVYRSQISASRLEGEVANRTVALQSALTTIDAQRQDAVETAVTDELTGLLNRRGLQERVKTQPCPACNVAFLSLDLDGFKEVNDTLGHMAGDKVLCNIGESLTKLVGDDGIVGRMGGDEFLVALNSSGIGRAEALAQKIVFHARQPMPIEGHEVRIGASIGITLQAGRKIPPDALLVEADLALYEAKRGGKNQWHVYGEELRQKAIDNKHLADDVRRALENDEFVPFFQPLHEAGTGRLTGVEALVRWNHPQKGLIPPNVFLPMAEKLGVLKDIDVLIMEKSAAAMNRLAQRGLLIEKLSVNVSYARLRDSDLLDSVKLLPEMQTKLAFELLEAIFLDEPDPKTLWCIDMLRAAGVEIAIDDFGTGHTSIVSLLRLGPDRIKLDRALIENVAIDEQQRQIVAMLVDMAVTIGIKVTAEGVEDMEQVAVLTKMGVSTFQGYVFSKPLDEASLLTYAQDLAA